MITEYIQLFLSISVSTILSEKWKVNCATICQEI